MTLQEAIKTLDVMRAEVEWEYPLDYAIAIDTAIGELEYRVPKKVIINMWQTAKCPKCNYCLSMDMTDGFYKHMKWLKVCPDCGQAIDWGEGEE